jgi:hypothetical protein
MNYNEGKSEFNVLGYKVVFRPDGDGSNQAPERIVNHVQNEADILSKSMPNLEPGQIAILLALRFARENLDLKTEFKDSIDKLHTNAKDALQYLEGIAPVS